MTSGHYPDLEIPRVSRMGGCPSNLPARRDYNVGRLGADECPP